jgi:Flp pilus assembly protein TadG
MRERHGNARSSTGRLSRFLIAIRRDDGQAMVETALSLILAFSVAFLLFEVSMLAYSYSVINNAAREGVRYAIVHGTDSSNCSGPSAGCADASAANVVAVVTAYAATTFHDISGMTVTVSYPDGTSSPQSLVTVTANYTFVPYFQFPALASTLHLTSQGRILY